MRIAREDPDDVGAGLFGSAVLVIPARPGRYGRRPGNPTIPLDHGRGLVIALGVLWAGLLALALLAPPTRRISRQRPVSRTATGGSRRTT